MPASSTNTVLISPPRCPNVAVPLSITEQAYLWSVSVCNLARLGASCDDGKARRGPLRVMADEDYSFSLGAEDDDLSDGDSDLDLRLDNDFGDDVLGGIGFEDDGLALGLDLDDDDVSGGGGDDSGGDDEDYALVGGVEEGLAECGQEEGQVQAQGKPHLQLQRHDVLLQDEDSGGDGDEEEEKVEGGEKEKEEGGEKEEEVEEEGGKDDSKEEQGKEEEEEEEDRDFEEYQDKTGESEFALETKADVLLEREGDMLEGTREADTKDNVDNKKDAENDDDDDDDDDDDFEDYREGGEEEFGLALIQQANAVLDRQGGIVNAVKWQGGGKEERDGEVNRHSDESKYADSDDSDDDSFESLGDDDGRSVSALIQRTQQLLGGRELEESLAREKDKERAIAHVKERATAQAAATVQAKWRGKMSRRRATRLRRDKRAHELNEAAVGIQRRYRGKRSRREVALLQEMRAVDASRNPHGDVGQRPQSFHQLKRERHRKRKEDAATAVQSRWRGKKSRRRVSRVRRERRFWDGRRTGGADPHLLHTTPLPNRACKTAAWRCFGGPAAISRADGAL